jgi:hypothetical protein
MSTAKPKRKRVSRAVRAGAKPPSARVPRRLRMSTKRASAKIFIEMLDRLTRKEALEILDLTRKLIPRRGRVAADWSRYGRRP